jgi:hypothetical protein
MSQDYSKLDEQIGDAGGTTPKKNLGKIQHQEIITGKAALSEEEEESRKAFNERKNAERAQRRVELSFESESGVRLSDGWVPVDRSEMGARSSFYPAEWEFYVKPAQVMAIKNWTAVDESNAAQVNNVLNEIIRTSVKIITNGVGRGGWQSINSWDRFWFILKVREATFTKGEAKIEFTDACSECDHDITYTLTSEALFYEFPDDELIDKHWQGRSWEIDPEEYDVNHAPITLYTPTLGKDQALIDWATARARQNQKLDENFIRFLSWMLDKPARDAAVLDRQIESLYKEYKSWDIAMFEFMEDVIRNITINPSEQLRVTCPNCGQEATSTVRFPSGIRALFKVETKAKKFGSR